MFGIAIEIWVIVGLIVLATMLLMSAFASTPPLGAFAATVVRCRLR